jgi:aminoglycoside phosphotransferase (APT) family kinase protein
LRLASGWLRRNMPTLDRHSIIHCDYRTGNFLFTEHDARITALLDWELGLIGDRHQDLAWSTSHMFGGLDDDYKTFLIGGMIPESKFIEDYERESGLKVNPKTLHWYKVYNNYSLAVMTIGTCYRIARNGKTHQDVLVTSLIGTGHIFLNQMMEQIEEGL